MKEQKLNRKRAKNNFQTLLRMIGEIGKGREFEQEYPQEQTNAKEIMNWFAEHLWVIEVMNWVIKVT